MSLLDRTFHPDEANQAFTAGRLLETGQYAYNPADHHGPTLYYAAAPLQRAFGHDGTSTLDGVLLRLTPCLFALLALTLVFLSVFRLLRASGTRPGRLLRAALPVLLLATAPMFAFFATDFIQEMLLVAFLAGMAWAATGYALPGARFKRGTWVLVFGIFAGLAFSTKETCILSFAAAAGAAAIAWISTGRRALRPLPTQPLVLACAGFLLTVTLLYSGFGRDFTGVADAFLALPRHYFGRAFGDAAVSTGADWHVHPWYQHLSWLVLGADNFNVPFTRFTIRMPFANLTLIIQLACFLLPIAISARRRTDGRNPLLPAFFFLTAYAVLLTILYSALPYKTPWCTLQLLVPFVLATGVGHLICADVFRRPLIGLVLLPALVLATEHVPGLVRLNADPDDPEIPCNYAAAHPEVKELAACVGKALTDRPDGFAAVILPACDTWPFPWYNRAHEGRTGYWTDLSVLERLAAEKAKPAVIIVPMTEGHRVMPLFPHLTHTKRFYIRPGVRVRVFW